MPHTFNVTDPQTETGASVPQRRWTQGDVTQLRTSVGAGEPVERIADRLQRETDEVATMMRRLRLR
jgi:hypothetical protein